MGILEYNFFIALILPNKLYFRQTKIMQMLYTFYIRGTN